MKLSPLCHFLTSPLLSNCCGVFTQQGHYPRPLSHCKLLGALASHWLYSKRKEIYTDLATHTEYCCSSLYFAVFREKLNLLKSRPDSFSKSFFDAKSPIKSSYIFLLVKIVHIQHGIHACAQVIYKLIVCVFA